MKRLIMFALLVIVVGIFSAKAQYYRVYCSYNTKTTSGGAFPLYFSLTGLCDGDYRDPSGSTVFMSSSGFNGYYLKVNGVIEATQTLISIPSDHLLGIANQKGNSYSGVIENEIPPVDPPPPPQNYYLGIFPRLGEV